MIHQTSGMALLVFLLFSGLDVITAFSAVVATDGLQLTIGTSVLPAQTISAGSVFIG